MLHREGRSPKPQKRVAPVLDKLLKNRKRA